jgi:hypothetical protein
MLIVPQHRFQSLDEWLVARLSNPDRLRDSRNNQARVLNWCQRDEGDTVGKFVRHRGRGTQRQAGLANPARAGQGEKGNVLTQEQLAHRGEFPLSANQRRARQ